MKKLAALCLAAVVTATSMGMATTPSVAHGKGGISFGLSFGSPHYYSYRPYRHRYYPAYPRRYYRPSYDAHVAWCYDRYRSYRAWDNTFQPYNGPRRQCRSPYA